MKAFQSFESKSGSKLKLKKNALEDVDIEKEWRKDPKYKTELCKSFEAKGVCVYGNKCRFAHGKNELFLKSLNNNNYKQKECFSFFTQGYCPYGNRCHFIHSEKSLHCMKRSYYSYLLSIYPSGAYKNFNEYLVSQQTNLSCMSTLNSPILKCSKASNKSINSNTSTISNDSLQASSIYLMQNNVINSGGSRLNVFNKIHLNCIKKNLGESFSNFEHQGNLTSVTIRV